MRVDIRAAFLLALAAAFLIHSPAWAQSDTRGLVDRLDRMERDLGTLQSQVYRGGGSTSVITSPSAGGGGGGALSGDTYSILDQRISALESQIRDLTGQIEKVSFNNSQMQAKLDRAQADNDFRFKELEQKLNGGAAGAGAAAGAAGASAGQAPASGSGQQQSKEWNPTMGSPPGNLGQIPANELKKAQQDAAPAAPPAKAANGTTLPGKTPQEQYEYAFGLLRSSDDEGAAKAFQAFVTQHPQDPLAGNAMYWLGRIPFAQGEYETAVPYFMEAYKKYPKSAKAAESLLDAGLSYSNLNKKKEACIVILHFQSEFPDAAENLKRQALQEKKKLGC